MTEEKTRKSHVRIWDLPLRVFHWALVVAISWSWIAIEILADLQQHFYAGYTVITLLLFRIGWGVCGTFYSRFRRLWFGVKPLTGYVRTLFGDSPQRFAGHNPLGSLAVIAMLALLITQVSTGLFSGDDYYFGPLAGWVEAATVTEVTKLHKLNFEILRLFIGLHIIAIIGHRLIKHEHLTAAMFTGHKRSDTINQAIKHVENNRVFLAMIVLIAAIILAYILIVALAQPVPLDDGFYY